MCCTTCSDNENVYFMILSNELRTGSHGSRFFPDKSNKILKIVLLKYMAKRGWNNDKFFFWVFPEKNKRFLFRRKQIFSFSVLCLPLSHFSLLSLLSGTIRL